MQQDYEAWVEIMLAIIADCPVDQLRVEALRGMAENHERWRGKDAMLDALQAAVIDSVFDLLENVNNLLPFGVWEL